MPPNVSEWADLVYDWNLAGSSAPARPRVELFDETLRDGLQNPSVADPPIGAKLKLLHLMSRIGVNAADLGLPGSSARAFEDVLRMCKEVTSCKLPLKLACAGRTLASDITPIVEISQRAGLPVEVYAFIGSSPIRQVVEAWDLELLKQRTAEAIDIGVRAGLPVAFVTEDTTRSRPEVLTTLFELAIDHGASRLCLCDTAGHATREGVHNVVRFTRELIERKGAAVKIDWHGHNDRGLALDNSIAAMEAGAERIHATALGVGERVGNTQMELLLMNLKLRGELDGQDLTSILAYCGLAADALGWQIPINYPLVGRDAFRTATGVHAAAIVKAESRGDDWLADRVYSAVPAAMIGRRQEICVGYMSGASNVAHWLRRQGLPAPRSLVDAILSQAKSKSSLLSDEEIFAVVRTHRLRAARR